VYANRRNRHGDRYAINAGDGWVEWIEACCLAGESRPAVPPTPSSGHHLFNFISHPFISFTSLDLSQHPSLIAPSPCQAPRTATIGQGASKRQLVCVASPVAQSSSSVISFGDHLFPFSTSRLSPQTSSASKPRSEPLPSISYSEGGNVALHITLLCTSR